MQFGNHVLKANYDSVILKSGRIYLPIPYSNKNGFGEKTFYLEGFEFIPSGWMPLTEQQTNYLTLTENLDESFNDIEKLMLAYPCAPDLHLQHSGSSARWISVPVGSQLLEQKAKPWQSGIDQASAALAPVFGIFLFISIKSLQTEKHNY